MKVSEFLAERIKALDREGYTGKEIRRVIGCGQSVIKKVLGSRVKRTEEAKGIPHPEATPLEWRWCSGCGAKVDAKAGCLKCYLISRGLARQ